MNLANAGPANASVAIFTQHVIPLALLGVLDDQILAPHQATPPCRLQLVKQAFVLQNRGHLQVNGGKETGGGVGTMPWSFLGVSWHTGELHSSIGLLEVRFVHTLCELVLAGCPHSRVIDLCFHAISLVS